MRDWDLHLEEVMASFSPYMLTRGTEKAIPLIYLYPEFASESFESHKIYVEQISARQQEIDDLV